MPVYRTDGAWGTGKGSNLSPAEVDGNFYELRSDLDTAIDSRLEPNNIASITATGMAMTITLDDGTTIGPIPLPVLEFRWREDWDPFSLYKQLDTFRVPTVGIFMTLLDHTSGATFDPNITVGGEPALLWIFAEITAAITAVDGDFLVYSGVAGAWVGKSPIEATALLADFVGDTGSGGLQGLVPAPAAGDGAAGKVLHANGVWSAGIGSLSGSSDVTLTGIGDNDVLAWHAATSVWTNRTPTALTALLSVMVGDSGSGGTKGLVPPPAAGDAAAGKVLSAAGTWVPPTSGGSIGGATDVALSSLADNDFLAYHSATSKWTNRTGTAVAALLPTVIGDAGAGGTKGLVPAPGIGDAAAGKVLGAGGTWVVPSGGGGGGGSGVSDKGAWNAILAYSPGDIVSDLGVGYLCRSAISAPGTTPSAWSTTGSANMGFSAVNNPNDHVTSSSTPAIAVTDDYYAGGKFYFEMTFANRLNNSSGAGIIDQGGHHAIMTFLGGLSTNFPGAGSGGSVGASIGTSAFAVDLDNNKIYFAQSASAPNWNGASANPGSNLGGITIGTITGAISPYFSSLSAGEQCTIINQASLFAGTPPTGFTPGWPHTTSSNAHPKADLTHWIGVNLISQLADVDLSSGPLAGDVLVYSTATSKWISQRQKYIIATNVNGVLSASQDLLHHRFTVGVTFAANFGDYLEFSSQAGGTANATASTVLNVDKAVSASPNSFTTIGTITIAAGTVTPTFATTSGAAQTFAKGDVLRIQGPASADATFAGPYVSLVGHET